jgi:cytochrome P450
MRLTTDRRPPGPKGMPFLGNLLDFRRDVLRYYSEWARQYGDIVALRLGPWPAVMLNHSDYAEYVLVDHHRNFIKFPFFFRHVDAIFGQGMLTSEGELWQCQRRLMAPAFQAQRLAVRRFHSLAELNVAIGELLIRLNEERPIRRLGVTRRQLLEELDRPTLKPLPMRRRHPSDETMAD